MSKRWLVLFGAVALGCGNDLSSEDRAAIHAWLRCEECAQPHAQRQLQRVEQLGDKAIEELARALRAAPAQLREDVRRGLAESYDRLRPGDDSGRTEYVSRYLGNFDAVYQTRAAVALSAIRTNEARGALRRALDSADVRLYRTDVVRGIHSALSTASFDTLTATFTPRSVRFLDTVRVSAGTGLPWDGDEGVILSGAPFPDSLVVARQTDSLKFLAVGEVGTYAPLITNLGPARDTQVARLNITQLAYTAHTDSTAPVLTAALFPQTRYLALGGLASDTVDHFRFQPTTDMALTLSLQWIGLRSFTMTWHPCAAPSSFVTFSGSTVAGVLRDERKVPIRGARVNIVGMLTTVTTDSLGAFHLTGVVPPVVRLRIRRFGFRVKDHTVHRGRPYVLTVVSLTANRTTAHSENTISVQIPGGQCWLLRLTTSRSTDSQIARLRITSP